ncbi:MAG: hypothetical protein ACBZ72_05125 [Candidatus Bathyarchaeia archaeon]|jgi:hypothetical protein
MQVPQLALDDVTFLFAIAAILLLVTFELASPNLTKTYLTLNKKQLKSAALAMSVLFFSTIALRIVNF